MSDHLILDRFLAAARMHGQTPQKRGEDWRMPCLAHGGDGYNLAVRMGEKCLVAKCHSKGCASEDIARAYGYEGIHEWFFDNGHERKPPTPAERARASAGAAAPKTIRYEIRDPDTGEVLATHVRKDTPGRPKEVWWEPRGVKPEALPLYGAHDLRDEAEQVVVTEGEKARDALQAWDIPAVGTVTGAKGCPCAESLEVLRGRDVILWPDKDAEGVEHMATLGVALDGIARSVRVVEPPADKPPKWDAADSIQDEARALVEGSEDLEAMPEIELGADQPEDGGYYVDADEIRTMPVEESDWHVEGLILRNSVTVIHGPPKEGKTTLLFSMCGALGRGESAWAGFGLPGVPVAVLYVSESSCAVLRPQPTKHKLNAQTVFMPNERQNSTLTADQVVEAVAEGARRFDVGLIVIDTLAEWGRVAGDGENTSGVMQAVIQRFRPLAQEGRAVVVVHHSNKSGEADPVTSLRGSSAIPGAVDCIARVYAANGGDPNTRKVWSKGRHDQQNQLRWVRWDDLAQTYLEIDAPAGAAGAAHDPEEDKRIVRKAITDLHARGDLTPPFGVDRAWRESGKTIPRPRFRIAATALVTDGILDEVTGRGAANGLRLSPSAITTRTSTDDDTLPLSGGAS